MFRKRWIHLAGLMAILLAAGYLHFTIRSHLPGVTGSNFDRLEVGMSQEQVEELLGGPAGIHAEHREWAGLVYLCTPGGNRTRKIWTSHAAAVVLLFDEQGRLDEKSWVESRDGFMGRFKRWLPGNW